MTSFAWQTLGVHVDEGLPAHKRVRAAMSVWAVFALACHAQATGAEISEPTRAPVERPAQSPAEPPAEPPSEPPSEPSTSTQSLPSAARKDGSAASLAETSRVFTGCENADFHTAKVQSLRDVDWCNFDYDGWVSLRGGSNEIHEYMEMGGMHDTIVHQLVSVAYGDLDGDSREEAVVLIREEAWYTNGSGSSGASMFLFELDRGRPKLFAREFANAEERMQLRVQADAVVQVAHRGDEVCELRWLPYASTPKDRAHAAGKVESQCRAR